MRRLRGHLLPIMALLTLVILQYQRLILDNRVLAGYDVLTYFYPNEQFAAESLKAGSLPLWNPYLFTGVPFLANPQTGIFYPLNAIFLLASVPRAYAYSVALHVFLSAVFAYVFAAGSLRIRRPGAFVVAAVYACGGFLTALAGHLNQLQASAWLPIILLLADLTYRRASPRFAALCSLAIAAQFLAGHVQEFYISMVCLAAFVAWQVGGDWLARRPRIALHLSAAVKVDVKRDGRQIAMVRGLLLVAIAVGLGGALTAIQALPTYELTRESIRSGGLSYWDAITFSLPPWEMLHALLPAYSNPQPFSEWIGYVGVAPLVFAGLALCCSRRPIKWLLLGIVVATLLLAAGQYTGVFQWAYQHVPGIKLFRVPARWLLLYTLAVAALSGLGLDALLEMAATRRRMLLAFAIIAAFVGLLVALTTVFNPGQPVPQISTATIALWLAASVGAVIVIVVGSRGRKPLAAVSGVCLIAAELLIASGGMDINRVNVPEAVSSLRPAVAHLLSQPGTFRVLPFSEGMFDPGDMPQLKNMLSGVIPPEAVYDYIVAAKHKETLTPNLPLLFRVPSIDGYDGGVLPLRRYVAFKKLFPLASPNVADGRLREQLHEVPDPTLLGWLNVRYILMDRTHDAWIDGVYYDLGLSRSLAAGADLPLANLSNLQSTAVGIVSHTDDRSPLSQGTVLAQVEVTLDDGQTYRLPLRAGIETAEGKDGQGNDPTHVRKAHDWPNGDGTADYFALLKLPRPSVIRGLRITGLAGTMVIRGLSFVDERRQLSEPVVVDPRLRLTHIGDVKVYENQRALERAFLVHDVAVARSGEDAIRIMAQANFDGAQTAVLEQRSPLPIRPADESGDEVIVEEYRPELVKLSTNSASPALLVLTDSYYPGWRVLVDGQPAEMLRVDLLFRGVALAPGHHEIRFEYQPRTLWYGAIVSLVTLGIVVMLLSGWASRRLRPRQPGRKLWRRIVPGIPDVRAGKNGLLVNGGMT